MIMFEFFCIVFRVLPSLIHYLTTPLPKKVGPCVKYEKKQDAVICKFHKPIFYSPWSIENISNVERETVYHLIENIQFNSIILY